MWEGSWRVGGEVMEGGRGRGGWGEGSWRMWGEVMEDVGGVMEGWRGHGGYGGGSWRMWEGVMEDVGKGHGGVGAEWHACKAAVKGCP